MLSNILKIVFIVSAFAESSNRRRETFPWLELSFDPTSFEKVGEEYYYFGKEKVSWYEAFLKCRLAGGLLASIEGKSEAKLLSDHLLRTHNSNEVWWLSGADLHKKGDFYWYGTGNAFNYTDWLKSQADNRLQNETCVYLGYQDLGYHMHHQSCNITSRYICEFKKPKNTEKELENTTTFFEKVSNKLYYFVQSESSWYNAFLKCRSLGGFLASINGPEEMQALSEHLTNKYPILRYWWLSAADFYRYNKFDWYATGKAMFYNKWSAAYHDNLDEIENCVHLWLDGSEYKMEAFPCYQKAYFICESSEPQWL